MLALPIHAKTSQSQLGITATKQHCNLHLMSEALQHRCRNDSAQGTATAPTTDDHFTQGPALDAAAQAATPPALLC
jgi:hypothetical protein